MQQRLLPVLLLAASFVLAQASAQSYATYLGGPGTQAFHDIAQLHDGTFLVGGTADDLAWLQSSVEVHELSAVGIANAGGTQQRAFLLHFDANLETITAAYALPAGAAESIDRIRLQKRPQDGSSDVFISGTTKDSRSNGGGYFIARLTYAATGIEASTPRLQTAWNYNVWAQGEVQDRQPWDVDATGQVTFVSGQAHGNDWAAVYRLNGRGERMVVPNWRTHWKTAGGEFYGRATETTEALNYSGIVLKLGRCDLRSWTAEAHTRIAPDGNGGTRRGDWPLDVLFNAPCSPAAPKSSGPGYTGYKIGGSQTYHGSSIAVDRRNGWIYLGLNVKSILPGGNPDFEPAVIAFDESGREQWWSRLYHEITPAGEMRNSTPDQYIDAIAIDYSQPAATGTVVVNARTHGNNTENFWEGSDIKAVPNAKGFQNRFSGTNGNIHISWVGKLSARTGHLQASTYVAELGEGVKAGRTPLSAPRFGGWPDPNAGWPDLNTTRLRPNAMTTTADGSVVILGTGRRTMTTTDAYQTMPLPGNGETGTWNDFVRQYSPQLNDVAYSTLVTGTWDKTTGSGGDNVELRAVAKTENALIAVGFQKDVGNALPTVRTPTFGIVAPKGTTAVLVRLQSEAIRNGADRLTGTSALPGKKALPQIIALAPNPSRGAATLYGLEIGQQVAVYDNVGRQISTTEASASVHTLPGEGLAPGMYTVIVRGKLGAFEQVLRWVVSL